MALPGNGPPTPEIVGEALDEALTIAGVDARLALGSLALLIGRTITSPETKRELDELASGVLGDYCAAMARSLGGTTTT